MAKTEEDTGQNSVTDEEYQEYIKNCEAIDAVIDEKKEACKAATDALHADISDIIDTAKDRGVLKKALRAALKDRKEIRKIEERRDNLKEKEQDQLDDIHHAVGTQLEMPIFEKAA